MSKFSSGETEVNILYSVATPQTNNEDMEHKSIITGVRHFVTVKEHLDFDIVVFLFKYANQPAALSLLQSYVNTLVDFAPYSEDYIRDSYGDKVKYYFESIKKYCLDDIEALPVLVLSFKATKGYQWTTATVGGYGHNYAKNYGKGL